MVGKRALNPLAEVRPLHRELSQVRQSGTDTGCNPGLYEHEVQFLHLALCGIRIAV